MGEMVMKKLFSKESFVFSSFDKQQKKQSLLVSLGLIVLFIFSSFTFMNMLYSFSDCIGSIVSGSPDVAIHDLLRALPLYFSFFMSLWGLLLFHACFRNLSDEKRNKSLKKNAISLLAFAGTNLVAIIILLAMGRYHSLIDEVPSPWFPLDSILYSLIYVALAVFTLVYLGKLQEKMPYVVPSRGPVVKKARGLYCTFVTIWMLIALFCFAGFALSFFIYDFNTPYLFYGIALIIVYGVNALFLAFWELYYNELKEENKKPLLLPIALIALVVSILSAVIYFVALGTNLDAPNYSGNGLLPVAFAASVNISTMVVVFTPVIVSIVALIKALVARKKKAE